MIGRCVFLWLFKQLVISVGHCLFNRVDNVSRICIACYTQLGQGYQWGMGCANVISNHVTFQLMAMQAAHMATFILQICELTQGSSVKDVLVMSCFRSKMR